MSINTFINLHKALVTPIVLGFMLYYDNWSTAAFVYLALHGTYSVLWIMKEQMYPDMRFEQKIPIWLGIATVFLPLASYYVAPFLLVSRHVDPAPWVYAVAICCYTFGTFFHYVGDAQKYFTLRLKKGLIDDGLFGRTRNPNYFGEILIYTAYAMLSLHWLPFVVLAGWTFGFFLRNMLKKDKSLSRHPGFAAYKARTGLLIPKLFRVNTQHGRTSATF